MQQHQKCQIGKPLSRIEEDGRNWLRRPKLCIKNCTAIIRRYEATLYTDKVWQ